MKIYNNIKKAIIDSTPFVAYRFPNSDILQVYFQKDDRVYHVKDFNKDSGFVFAPFNLKEDTILFPREHSIVLQEQINLENNYLATTSVTHHKRQKSHVELVKKGINAIENNQFRKVVLSRKEKVVLSSDLNELEVFSRLIVKYPTAFVYFWSHPKIGKWMGATPETLLSMNDNLFKTMSLAGTQTYIKGLEPHWDSKEIDEQHIVTTYIKRALKPICEQLHLEALETIKIGNLLHLRTRVSGKVKQGIAPLIEALHPTPAVCGVPKEQAKEFILKEEKYHREFYTGFLGEINKLKGTQSASELFVNLRCMKVLSKNVVYVYVGGGVTLESNPKKEWLETIAKSVAIKSVL